MPQDVALDVVHIVDAGEQVVVLVVDVVWLHAQNKGVEDEHAIEIAAQLRILLIPEFLTINAVRRILIRRGQWRPTEGMVSSGSIWTLDCARTLSMATHLSKDELELELPPPPVGDEVEKVC